MSRTGDLLGKSCLIVDHIFIAYFLYAMAQLASHQHTDDGFFCKRHAYGAPLIVLCPRAHSSAAWHSVPHRHIWVWEVLSCTVFQSLTAFVSNAYPRWLHSGSAACTGAGKCCLLLQFPDVQLNIRIVQKHEKFKVSDCVMRVGVPYVSWKRANPVCQWRLPGWVFRLPLHGRHITPCNFTQSL